MKFLFAIPLFLSAAYLSLRKLDINYMFMKFFRDLSRSKARRRLHRNDAALVPMILGRDQPISIDELFKDIKSDGFTMTASQLSEMNGINPNTPIYLAVKGLIYDVTANRHIYGPGKSYHKLVARDSSWALATGCLEDSCINTSGI
jgi:hypothetical protein